MKTPTNIERFDAALKNNSFTMDEELHFINSLVTKYNLLTKQQYAKREGVSSQGVLSRLKAKTDPHFYIAGKLFIIS